MAAVPIVPIGPIISDCSDTPIVTAAPTLETIRANILARIAEVTAAPKPNYNIDGQEVSWQDYLDSLFTSLKQIDDNLQTSEPFEVVSRGIT